jgi:glyoxylase-like metal-dependent hydrolase (beta-lactamase superfamily II)
MAATREIAPGLWRWTGRHPEWHPGEFGAEVASFALRDGDDTILVDPLVDAEDEELLRELDGLVRGRLRIFVTIPYHVRSSELLWRRYRGDRQATIVGHPNAAKRLRDASGFRPLAPGDRPEGGVRAHPIGRPRRSEAPLELPSHRALAFGDAVVEVGGGLRVWETPLTSERRRRWYDERLLPSLRALLDLDVERVLVTHGRPVLEDGRAALARALERPPWSLRTARQEARAGS